MWYWVLVGSLETEQLAALITPLRLGSGMQEPGEPEPEPQTMWLAPIGSDEATGDVSPSLVSTVSPRARSPTARLDANGRDMPAEVARLVTALRREVLRREAAEARLVAVEAAHRKLAEDATSKRSADEASLEDSQHRHSLLRAQLTAAAAERRRLGAQEESLRLRNDGLHGQVETLQLRVAAVSAERDRLLRKLSGSQALIDQAKAGEAAALKLASQRTQTTKSALIAQRREVDEMATDLDAVRRCVRITLSCVRVA